MTWADQTVSGALSFLEFVCTDGLVETIPGIVASHKNHFVLVVQWGNDNHLNFV
jgi:hypothetical protein